MAERPIYTPSNSPRCLFSVKTVYFNWHSGFSPTQKKKNVIELHNAAFDLGIKNVLEVSSKSELEVGRRLSSFNLKLEIDGEYYPLESIYQGSKIFEFGGPYIDIMRMSPRDAKRDERLRKSGKIIGFYYRGRRFSNFPLNAFYDWIYLKALAPHENYIRRTISEYDGFSDVEFNPKVSLNTQARALAVYMTLLKRSMIFDLSEEYEKFEMHINIHEKYCNEKLK